MDTNMDDSVQQQSEPKLCGKCFSFFGNPACLGMCSKCYREHESEVVKQAAVQEKAVAVAEAAAHVFPIPASPKQPDAPMPMVAEPTPSPQANPPLSTPPAATAAVPTPTSSSSPAAPAAESSEAAAASSGADADPPEAPKPVQKHPNRCFSCNKKVGLTGFKCRCSYIFCSEHRYSDKHACTYDYKSQQKELLTKANPTVIADKIQRI